MLFRSLLIAVYLELAQLYRENQVEQRFGKAGDFFMQHANTLPLREKRHLLTHFTNMGIPLYSLENRPIGDSLLALYRWALQAGLLVVNQRMTETTS